MYQRKKLFTKRTRIIAGITLSLIALMFFIFAPATGAVIGTSLGMLPVWGFVKDKTFKELSVEEIEKLEPSDQVKYFNELNLHREQKLETMKIDLKKQNSETLKEEIKALKAEITADNVKQMSSLQKAMEDQGMALRQIMSKGGTVKETLETYLEKNKELLISIVKDGVNKTIIVKADTLRANVVDSHEAYQVPDLGQIGHRTLSLYDLFAKVPVGAGSGGVVSYYDWDEATTVKAAAVIAEGGTFPASTAKWKWYSKPLVKIGVIMPVSDEFEIDMPRFYAELAQFLQIDVSIAVDDQLYSGSGAGNQMTGLYTSATVYTAVASGIADASIYDLLVKVREKITATKGSKYNPNFALMNSSDISKYKLKKDANNNYIVPPFVTPDGKKIDGLTVIETNVVTANTLVIGDNRFAKIYEVSGYALVKGLATGDFEDDKFSLKAKRRMLLLMKNADKSGFYKVESISAALTLLATS